MSDIEEAKARLTRYLAHGVAPIVGTDTQAQHAADLRTLLSALAQPKEGEIPANLFDRPEDVDEAMRERRQAYPLPTAHMPSREEVRTALALAFTNMKADDLRWKATSHEGFDRAMDHLTDALFKGEA